MSNNLADIKFFVETIFTNYFGKPTHCDVIEVKNIFGETSYKINTIYKNDEYSLSMYVTSMLQLDRLLNMYQDKLQEKYDNICWNDYIEDIEDSWFEVKPDGIEVKKLLED